MMEQQVNYPCETLIAFPQVDRHDLVGTAAADRIVGAGVLAVLVRGSAETRHWAAAASLLTPVQTIGQSLFGR
jgi:hypothetical protein